jgi:nucleosome assembly protein 1-like 1
MIAEIIEPWDEPILKCLDDIKLRLQIQPIHGFTLEFYFNDQSKEYFHNEILTKFYELQIEPDDELLFYEGTAIVRSIGCHIDWINSKSNVTRNDEKDELQSSFFHFFTTSIITDDWKLAMDFQIGHYIREYLLPKAILYYTGEIFDDEYEFSDDDDDESDEEQIGEGEH